MMRSNAAAGPATLTSCASSFSCAGAPNRAPEPSARSASQRASALRSAAGVQRVLLGHAAHRARQASTRRVRGDYPATLVRQRHRIQPRGQRRRRRRGAHRDRRSARRQSPPAPATPPAASATAAAAAASPRAASSISRRSSSPFQRRGHRHSSAAPRPAPCRAGNPPARRRPSDSARHCRAWRDTAAAGRYTDARDRSVRGIWRKKNVSSSVRICEPSTSASVMITMRW